LSRDRTGEEAASLLFRTRAAQSRFLSPLDNEKLATFDLGHDTAEDAVDERIEGGIAGQVVRDVDMEALVRRDGRSKSMKNVGKGWQGAVADSVACSQ
jgi:hypothetical protein